MEKYSFFRIWILIPPFNFLLFLLSGLSRVEWFRVKSPRAEPLEMDNQRGFFLFEYYKEQERSMALKEQPPGAGQPAVWEQRVWVLPRASVMEME